MASGTRIESEIVQIGNSQGVRIPKSVLEQCQLKGDIVMEIHEEGLMIRPSREPRKGWEEAFAKAKTEEKDELEDFLNIRNEWDDSEWTW